MIDIDTADIAESGRLMPGKMMLIDTSNGNVYRDPQIKDALASAHPYRDWLEKNRLDLADVSSGRTVDRSVEDADFKRREFMYGPEDIERIIIPSILQFKEPVSS